MTGGKYDDNDQCSALIEFATVLGFMTIRVQNIHINKLHGITEVDWPVVCAEILINVQSSVL